MHACMLIDRNVLLNIGCIDLMNINAVDEYMSQMRTHTGYLPNSADASFDTKITSKHVLAVDAYEVASTSAIDLMTCGESENAFVT